MHANSRAFFSDVYLCIIIIITLPAMVIQCEYVLIWLTYNSSQSTSVKTDLMNVAVVSKQ